MMFSLLSTCMTGAAALVAWYAFEPGPQILDSSGQGLHGVVYGSSVEENAFFGIYRDHAKAFNGTSHDTHVAVADAPGFSCFGSEFTLECWYRNDGSPSGNVGRILGKGNAFSSGFDLRIMENNRLAWVVVHQNEIAGSSRIYLQSSATLEDKRWYHLAVSARDIRVDGRIDTEVALYIDGVLDKTYTRIDSGGMRASTGDLQMMGGSSHYARGAITRVGIWNDARTAFDQPLRVRALFLHLPPLFGARDALVRRDIERAREHHYTHIVLRLAREMEHVLDPIGNPNAYSREQVKSLIEHAYTKGLRVIPETKVLTHAEKVFVHLQDNPAYQPADPLPTQRLVSKSGSTANPYYAHNGHSFFGIVSNHIHEVLSLFSELYDEGRIAYQHPDYFMTGFDEMRNTELQTFIDLCGPPEDTVRSVFVRSINEVNDLLRGKTGGQTDMMIFGDMLISKQLAEPPYGDPGFLTYRGPMNGTEDELYLAVLNKEIAEDVILVDWSYSSTDVHYPSLRFFDAQGYRNLGASWYSAENIYSWGRYVHEGVTSGQLAKTIGMVATSWSDGLNYNRVRADRFDAMLPTAGSIFREIGTQTGVQKVPSIPVVRSYAKREDQHDLSTFFSNCGNDTVVLSASVHDEETPSGEMTGLFHVIPPGGDAWIGAEEIDSATKTISGHQGETVLLTYHAKFQIPEGAEKGPWAIKFTCHDADRVGLDPTPKIRYTVKENAFIVNSSGMNDFTEPSCVAHFSFNYPGDLIPNLLPGSGVADGGIIGEEFEIDRSLHSDHIETKCFNAKQYNTHVSVPHNSSLDFPGSEFTVKCFYKNNGTPSGSFGRIIGKGDAFTSGFDLQILEDNRLAWVVVHQDEVGGQSRVRLNSSAILEEDLWYHLAATARDHSVDGRVDTEVSLYINGELNATYTRMGSGGMKKSMGDLQMMGGDSYYARGSLGGVRLYNEAKEPSYFSTGVYHLDFDRNAPDAYDVIGNRGRFFNLARTRNVDFESGCCDASESVFFNGIDSEVTVPPQENIVLGDAFYIQFKMKINEYPLENTFVFRHGEGFGQGIDIMLLSTGRLNVRLWTWSDEIDEVRKSNAFRTTSAFPLDQWVDVVLSYDGTQSPARGALVLDGELHAEVDLPGERIHGRTLHFGSWYDGSRAFKGNLDQFKIMGTAYELR